MQPNDALYSLTSSWHSEHFLFNCINCFPGTNTQNSNTVSLVVGLVLGGLALVALWVIAIIACKKLGRKEPSIGKLRKSGQNFPLNYNKSWLTRSSALSSQIPNAWLPYGRYGYGNYNYWWSNPYLQRPYGSVSDLSKIITTFFSVLQFFSCF